MVDKYTYDRIISSLDRISSAYEKAQAQEEKREGKQTQKDVSPAGAISEQLGQEFSTAVSSAIREGFNLLSGGIVSVLRSEIQALATEMIRTVHQQPLARTEAHIREMSRAGVALTPDQIQAYHQRVQRQAQIELQGIRTIRIQEGLVPSALQEPINFWQDFIYQGWQGSDRPSQWETQRDMMGSGYVQNQRNIHDNMQMQGD